MAFLFFSFSRRAGIIVRLLFVGLLLLLPPTEVGRRSFVFCCLSLFLEVAPNGSWQAKISSFVVVSSRFTTSGYKRLVFCCLYLFLVVAPNVSWQAMVSSFVFYTNSICTNLFTCQSLSVFNYLRFFTTLNINHSVDFNG